MSAGASFTDQFEDPRITDQFCRKLPGTPPLVLVGVVHDHPSSIGRVERILEAIHPKTLALELPPAAVPLYRREARRSAPPERVGGEMIAAIRAATVNISPADENERPVAPEIVGIDGPNLSMIRRLCTRVLTERVSLETTRRLLASLRRATGTAISSRIAATVSNATATTLTGVEPLEYSCSPTDPPTTQATHERNHVAGVNLFLDQGNSSATDYRDEAREASMIERLESLRKDGPVVAIVGVDHLETLADALA
ncbi:hypothetical protein OB919_03575 [Halobacteria archaeon AArc-curdl1]|uniref:Uncharacterized protein n=1 Tax=Natronosalvus hydrolyticus TaxID=2979988 RepID=A0AAP2Z6F4_9EURY|nr:hypothetical protein [Halobacteria archaeon AArc-curdl1]